MGRFFCADGSARVGESLPGTAPDGTWAWLGVELSGTWAPDPLASPGMGAALREALVGWHARPGHRVQLVHATPGGPRGVWWADTRPGHEALWHWTIQEEQELIDDLARPGPPDRARRVEGPAIWVCTHGRRDACCAKFGMATWRALAERADIPVLRTSHLGGHRFAPTLLALPAGLLYGRIAPGDADDLLDAVRAGRVWLDRLRGRVALPRAAQAAEHAVRAALDDAVSPLMAATATSQGEGVTDVRLSLGGRDHAARVVARPGPALRTSCGATEPSATVAFEVRLDTETVG